MLQLMKKKIREDGVDFFFIYSFHGICELSYQGMIIDAFI